MPSKLEYLLTLIITCLPVLVFANNPTSVMHKNFKSSFLAVSVVAPFWLIWDFFATLRGHWGFNYNYTLGIKILNLPLEEVAFFWVVPLTAIFTWEVINNFKSFQELWKNIKN